MAENSAHKRSNTFSSLDGSISIDHAGTPAKKLGCWSKFKSIFDGRGFDLEYEYSSSHNQPVVEAQNDIEGYRKLDERRLSVDNKAKFDTLDGELTGVINFYEQFATLGDENEEPSTKNWKTDKYRSRVSVRPSLFLPNIVEETSLSDNEVDDIEVVSDYNDNSR